MMHRNPPGLHRALGKPLGSILHNVWTSSAGVCWVPTGVTAPWCLPSSATHTLLCSSHGPASVRSVPALGQGTMGTPTQAPWPPPLCCHTSRVAKPEELCEYTAFCRTSPPWLCQHSFPPG